MKLTKQGDPLAVSGGLRRHTIESRSSPVCMGVQRRIVSRNGHEGPWVCGKMADVWKGYKRMRKETPCGHEVRVQDPDDERQQWRWECQRGQRHRGTHMATNGVRTFEWQTHDCVISANAEAQRPEGYAAAADWVCGCGTKVHGKSATCPKCGADWYFLPNARSHDPSGVAGAMIERMGK